MVQKKKEKKVFAPVSLKSRLAINTQEDIVLLGGAAGSGKSFSLLLKLLDAIQDPTCQAVVFRRSRPQLLRPGGLVSDSWKVFPYFNGVFNKQSLTWSFPNGATINFQAIGADDEATLSGFQGLQASLIAIDELADEWPESTLIFLLSRLRSGWSSKKNQLVATCNPNSKSFLRDWVEFSLDPETGIPKPDTHEKVRWMLSLGDKVVWANSEEELYEIYGKPRGLIPIKGLSAEEIVSLEPTKLFAPKSFRFIPSTIYDNGFLLPPRNTTYLAGLLAQSERGQRRFLFGSWHDIQVEGNYFKREWCKEISYSEFSKIPNIKLCRSYDLAASTIETNRQADYTAGVLIGRDQAGNYYIVDVTRFQQTAFDVLNTIIRQSHEDGQHIPIVIPRDPGQSGKYQATSYLSTLSEAGCIVKFDTMAGARGKLQRFLPFCQIAEGGLVYVVKGDWNEDWYTELEKFSDDPKMKKKQHDDMLDATASGFKFLARGGSIPQFSLGSVSRSSPLN